MIRAAHSLDVALAQLNTLAPNRSKASDGGVGDAAHAARQSDHNPDGNGVFHARDFTHDPANGADMSKYTHTLCMDTRATYVIFQNMFYDKAGGLLRIRPYPSVNPAGAAMNPHNHHLHLSVASGALGDDQTPWEAFRGGTGSASSGPGAGPESLPALIAGNSTSDPHVVSLQRFLNAYNWVPALPILIPDGFYGPKTTAVVAAAQVQCGITGGDGRNIGPQTRAAFWSRGWRV